MALSSPSQYPCTFNSSLYSLPHLRSLAREQIISEHDPAETRDGVVLSQRGSKGS